MRPNDRDAAYLWDMLQACRDIAEFAGDVNMEAFLADRKLLLALERCLEIIGEAAERVSESFQVAHGHVPWRMMRRMRNILAHEYGQVDYAVVYRIVMSEVPALRVELEKLLP